MKKPLVLTILCLSPVLFAGLFSMCGFLDTAVARSANEGGFDERSLSGSYASSGRADGFQSASIGVTTFNGRGEVARVVTINASDGEGGRRLIEVVSVGTYTVDPDGQGVITFVNQGLNNTVVNFDFVISTSSPGGSRGALQADTITGIQREAGVTASLIEEIWSRREGL